MKHRSSDPLGQAIEPRELCRITVPLDPNLTSDNRTRGLHWTRKAARFRGARDVARLAWRAAGEPRAAGRVRVSFIVRRARRMDTTNVVGGLKPCIDGMFVDGITPSDGPDWFALGGVEQEIAACWRGREEVVVVVEEG